MPINPNKNNIYKKIWIVYPQNWRGVYPIPLKNGLVLHPVKAKQDFGGLGKSPIAEN